MPLHAPDLTPPHPSNLFEGRDPARTRDRVRPPAPRGRPTPYSAATTARMKIDFRAFASWITATPPSISAAA